MSTGPDHESHPAHPGPVEAGSTPREREPGLAEVKAALTEFGENILNAARAAWTNIKPALSDAGLPVRRCVLCPGHDGPVHIDANGVRWTGPDGRVIAGTPDEYLDRAEAAEAMIAELTADCDELIAKNRTVIQQGADALARATRAEVTIQRVRKFAEELEAEGAVWDGNEQRVGRDLLAVLDERQPEAPSNEHILVVHAEPDDGMEIEHPDNCPVVTTYGGRVEMRVCPVGEIDVDFGLDEYFHRAGTQGQGEVVTVGRHPIEYWTNGLGDDRFDCGLRLIAVDEEGS